jgi:hypothetical protein
MCNLARAMHSSRRTVVSIAALALTVGLALGCGAVNKGSSGEAGGDSSPSVSVSDDGSPSEPRDAPPVPAANEMSVFGRPRTEADLPPGDFSDRLKSMACPDWYRAHTGCPGDPIGDETRLLVSSLGATRTNLYAWPTTNGWVCWAWRGGAGSCVRDFADGGSRATFMGIDPDEEGIGAPGTLVGLVPDDVVAVEVKVRGVQEAAVIQSNGLFYELPDGSCTNWAFESLTATYRDGSSDTVPIKWHHGSRELPETCAG